MLVIFPLAITESYYSYFVLLIFPAEFLCSARVELDYYFSDPKGIRTVTLRN